MMLFPLRVEDAQVDRLPWVSIGIAGLCAALFVATWILPSRPDGMDPEAFHQIAGYYESHPYLELAPRFTSRFLHGEPRRAKPPDDLEPAELAAEQAHLDELIDELLASADASLLRRLSLVPARGALQLGWLTHMFVHFGWLHIIGNLFFFYLVGPLLEDVWGRPFFGAFFVVGGLFAALAHYSLEPHSTAMMAGASGAIAACIGAFTWRWAHRQIRMAYMIGWFKRGTFLMPAWTWGLFWFGGELLSFFLHSSEGVAVMAHIGGFGAGLAAAVVLARTGFEEKHLAPALARKVMWTQHEAVDRARAALDQGDREGALAAFREALADRPDDPDAVVGLARLDGDLSRVDKLLAAALGSGDQQAAWGIALELGRIFEPAKLAPATAYKLAGADESAPEGLVHLIPLLDAVAASAGGVIGAKALLRCTRRSLTGRDRETAAAQLRQLRAIQGLPPELVEQIARIAVEVGPVAAKSAERAPAAKAVELAAPLASPEMAVRILTCRLLRFGEVALEVESAAGQKRSVDLNEVLAVGAGIVPSPEGAVMMTDLVVSWGGLEEPPAAIRIAGGHLGLAGLYPALSTKEAYAKLLGRLLQATHAVPLPDLKTLESGSYPRFASLSALNAAFYGKPR